MSGGICGRLFSELFQWLWLLARLHQPQGGGGHLREVLVGVCRRGFQTLTLLRQNPFIVLPCLRYHGTPKLTMFSKNTLLSFSDRYYSNLSFKKSFRKKTLFLRKVMDERRFVALIFSNHVLTVICQQR